MGTDPRAETRTGTRPTQGSSQPTRCSTRAGTGAAPGTATRREPTTGSSPATRTSTTGSLDSLGGLLLPPWLKVLDSLPTVGEQQEGELHPLGKKPVIGRLCSKATCVGRNAFVNK